MGGRGGDGGEGEGRGEGKEEKGEGGGREGRGGLSGNVAEEAFCLKSAPALYYTAHALGTSCCLCRCAMER